MNVNFIITNAFISDLFSKHFDILDELELNHISDVVDYNSVPDNVIVDNIEIRNCIRWDRINKMKLIRLLIRFIDRDLEDLEEIKKNIQKYDYKIRDLHFLFMRDPRFIDFFNIDLQKLNTNDAALLLSFGSDYFLEKINLSNYVFNFRESMNIIIGYKYDRDIIEKVNYKSLKGYQISEILSETEERDIDILNLSLMNSIDWVNLLKKKPGMIKYCDYKTFKESDIFNSIQLCCMFKDLNLSYLILERDLSEISPLGWEILLINKPNEFVDLCDFKKLEEINWINILNIRPELSIYKI